MTLLFTYDFPEFYATWKKSNGIFGIFRKFSALDGCFLCKNVDLKIWHYLIQP